MLFDKSFAILRTNPALTTNVKLVIDSLQNLYLESFQISKQLSENQFRHYPVKKTDYLFDAIPTFWNGVEATLAFDTDSTTDYYSMYDDFRYQFDDTYYSGAAATEDTWYSEEFEILAPLWVNRDALPVAYIIFRVDGPGLSDGNSPYNFRSDVLANWKMVSFFDLTTENNFGSFLNKQTSHPYYPATPTFINYEDLRFSVFSGIDFNLTGYVQKSLDFDPIKSLNTRIFELEEKITDMWRDLGLIFPHILNLKFLFDDTPASPTTLRDWSINRYMGFYVDKIDQISSVSPYKPYDLKKTPNELLESLTPLQVSELPYVLNNTIVQDVNNRRYTFDPISGNWNTDQQYWVEWIGQYYRLVRETNDDASIIGQYRYKIVSNVNISYSAPSDVTNPTLISQYTKVLLNELSTLKYQVEVTSSLVFENITGHNVIQNVNSTYTTLNRLFQQYNVNGQLVWGFRIQLFSTVNNNLFSIPNFDTFDLVYMEINGVKYIVKQYPTDIPNIGGFYYLQTDYAINVTASLAEQWVNAGNVSKDPNYYFSQDVESVAVGAQPIFYNIYRAAFTDIKDFDFTRLNTEYSKYEYELSTALPSTLEMKLYNKERRPLNITMYTPIEINATNFSNDLFHSYLSSDPFTFNQFSNQYTQPILRSPISPEVSPVRMYFHAFANYVDFKYSNIIAGTTYYVNGVTFKETLTTYKSKMPLYITPTRQPVLDINNNQALDPVTGLKLWQTDINGAYIYTPQSTLKKTVLPNNREYYREEGYIYLQNDNPVTTIDFLSTNEPTVVQPSLTFDPNVPMATTMKWSPFKQSVEDPNQLLDPAYLPTTSEYITSEELWETRSGDTLSPIWNKSQSICKWGFMNSIDTHDYGYRLSYDLEVSGLYNNSCNPFNQLDFAARRFRDLDYFYRCGIDPTFQTLSQFTLHLKEPFFDYDKYFGNSFDYFDYVFHSDYLTAEGIKPYKKYSTFDYGDATEGPFTLFKGIKWRIYDVSKTIFDTKYPAQQFVEDYERVRASTYNGYKFSILMGRKLSTFQNLNGNNGGDFGIDVIINEVYKNVIIFLYFETDSIVTFGKTLSTGSTIQVNFETSDVDSVYEADQIATESVSASMWQNGQLKINGTQSIGDVRIRDLKLFNFLAVLNEKNYNPSNGSGRQPVRYVRIKGDNSVKVMTSANTDFVIDAELPIGFLIKEKTSVVSTSMPNNLQINNSVKNTIILNDTDNPNATVNSAGALINSVLDINAWDGMPLGRSFKNNDPNDTRMFYNLDSDIDPQIYRHSGPYAPIFNDLNLFRPVGYWTSTNSQSAFVPPVVPAYNWKFYDDFSDGNLNGPSVYSWGYIPEIIFSKVNSQGNVLKTAISGDTKSKAIYPMVDEYGYDVNPRYLFQSTWDRNFFLESRLIVLNKNDYPTLAGYTVFVDGYSNFLKINDNIKFNLVPSGYGPDASIAPSDSVVLVSPAQTQINVNNLDVTQQTAFSLIDNDTKQQSTLYFFTPSGDNVTPGATNIAIDSFISSVTFSPDNVKPTAIIIQSSRSLSYEINFYTTATNFNGHTYVINRQNSGSSTLFANAFVSVQPINGQIMFTMVTDTRGTIFYDYFIPPNVPREKFLKEFSVTKFASDSNAFLNPDYKIINVTGDVNNISFEIIASVAGPAYNFTIKDLKNAVENTAQHHDVPALTAYVEKSNPSELMYVGQNQAMNQFTNKCIGSFTVEFWIKADAFKKDYETIMYKGSVDPNDANLVNNFSWIIRRHNDTSKIEWVTQSYVVPSTFDITAITPYDPVTQSGTPIFTNVLASNTDIDDGQMHYVAFVFDSINNKKYIYVDQVQDAIVEHQILNNVIVDPDPNIEDKNWHIIIGADYQNGALNFRGSIDELRIWNYARSNDQIVANYNLRLNPYSYLNPAQSLVAYYRFDEGAGALQINDFSNAIFELERVSIVSSNSVNNGMQITTTNDSSYFQNEASFFDKTPIIVSDVSIHWQVSGADIKGVSDERYIVSPPVATSRTTLADLPVVITPRSKFAGEFQPSIDAVPRPTPPVPVVPAVKVVTVPPHILNRPKPLKISRYKRRHRVIRFSFDPEKKRVFDGLDRFNSRISFLKFENFADDIVTLDEREQILNEQPLEYLNNRTVISNNSQDSRVTFSQNKSIGVTSQYNSLVFKPINNLLRRL